MAKNTFKTVEISPHAPTLQLSPICLQTPTNISDAKFSEVIIPFESVITRLRFFVA